jgi:hypothetical protein
LFVAAAATWACSNDVLGPQPSLAPGVSPPTPNVVCQDQLTSSVQIHGTDFSPVPVDVPNGPRAALPDVTLTLAKTLSGSAGDGSRISFSGDSDHPTNLALLSWQSSTQMTFTVNQDVTLADGSAGSLPLGIYDINVQNANGSSADYAGGLAIVDRPSLAAPPKPGITCLAQDARKLQLDGAMLLEIAGQSPRLEVQGVADPIPVPSSGLADCDDVADAAFATRYCTSATLTLPEAAIPPGYPKIVLRNPESAACASEETLNLRVVPPPSISGVEQSIACVAQGARSFVIHGSDFLEIDGAPPDVTIGGAAFSPTLNDADCERLETMGHQVRRCTALHLDVGSGALSAGTPEIVVTNPAPAGCNASDSTRLRIVAPPSVASVAAPMACVEQGPVTVDIHGSGFLRIDGLNPTVSIGGTAIAASAVSIDGANCTALQTDGHTVQDCSVISVTLAQHLLDQGLPEVSVENPTPAGCVDTKPSLLRVVPPPSVTGVLPPLICVADAAVPVQIVGTDFLMVDGAPPAVTVGTLALDPSAVTADPGDCESLPVAGMTVSKCTKLTALLPQAQLASGTPDVQVQNPAPAACANTGASLLTVAPGPSITGAGPSLACTQGTSHDIVLTGTGFLQIGATTPSVTLDGTPALVNVDSGSCQPVVVNGRNDVSSCTSLTVTAPIGSLTPGAATLVLTNPNTAACAASNATVLTVPPLISFASATPGVACSTQNSQSVVVSGTGFVRVGASSFTVTVAGSPVTPSNVSGCTPLNAPGLSAEACTSFSIDVNPSTLGVGAVAIEVTNPSPAGCALSNSTVFEVAPPPSISAVDPVAVCTGDAISVDLTGTGFVNNMRVFFEDGSTSIQASSLVVHSATSATATVEAPGLDAGTYDLRVDNGPGCEDTLPAALEVDPLPVVFFVNPQVLYNDISIDATIFTAELPSTAQKVELVDGQGGVTEIDDFTSPPGQPNRIVATVPSGLATGEYEVRVTSQLGCSGGLPGAVTVTDTLSITLDPTRPLDPSFVSSTTDTAVTIFATAGGAPFENGAIAYVDSAGGGGSSTARELRAVVVDSNDPKQLTAVVPGGLDPGVYNLIVINPSGSVGVAQSAVTITATEPPVVTNVQPIAVTNQSDQPAKVFGRDFDPAGVSVKLICTPPGGGTASTLVASVGTVTSTQADVTLPVSGLAAETVCQVQLVNSASGASSTFSAISVRNPAANLAAWSATGSNLVQARRALGLVAARPTNTSRFLYAIGGDNGAVAGAKTSIEAVSTDGLGRLGSWRLERNGLPAARTLAGTAQIGRFVYLTGGHDGTNPTNTTLRAQVLDPLTTPVIADLDAELGDGTLGLEAGLWHYRVSALFPNSDASNPNGESLPGEVLSIHVPNVSERVIFTLHWDAIPGATAYRVYRTAQVNETVDALEGLADVACDGGGTPCQFSDDESTATNPTQTPLPPGSLGVWHPVATMLTAREGHVSVIAPKPGSTTQSFLYSFGGRTAGGVFLNSYEFATITVAPDGGQTLSSWTAGTRNIGTAKAELGAWVIAAEDTSLVTDPQIFVGTGRTSASADTGEIRSGLVSATGDLSAASGSVLDAETSAGAGAASASADGGGFLYLFGGERGNTGNTVATDSSSSLTAGPDLSNWNSLAGGSLITRRSFAACARESAFYYVAGGKSNSTAALNSVEQTVQ